MEYPNLTVTFLIEHNKKFLLVSRGSKVKNFPSHWAFPGGKVEFNETVIDTIRREVKEETGIELTGEACFLDSYFFSKSVGLAFLVRANGNKVTLNDEIEDYIWVSSIEELKNLKCIPGIYNHLQRAIEKLNEHCFDVLERMNLTEIKYLNK